MAKRAFDLIVSGAALVMLAPLLAIVALAIKLDSRGPVFYRGDRVGRNGVNFKMYKFRSMVTGADRQGSALTRRGDARVTRVGRALRQTKIDELPQLINVLRGEMSLVGPRPEAPVYVQCYTPEQREVLRVRPGITGLTQVEFRHEEALLQHCVDLETEYVRQIMPQKLRLDLEYIRRRSLLLDMALILRTVACLFTKPHVAGTTQVSQRVNCQATGFGSLPEGPAAVPAASFSRRLKLIVRRRLSPGAERRLKGRTNDLMNWLRRTTGQTTRPPEGGPPIASSYLAAGERVRVRSRAEIDATLNNWRQLRGCTFMPEMGDFCGTTQCVLKRLERFVDERDLRAKACRGIVLLEGVTCQGTAEFGRCDRSCLFFWREEWLERVV